MNQSTLEALLKRPLDTYEVENRKLYLKIARENLEQMICSSLVQASDEARVYGIREGYRTVFTDIFTEITQVKVNGSVVSPSKYTLKQWDRQGSQLSWYNSIVFDDVQCYDEVEITGSWGFDCMPYDLQSVQAGLFDLIGKKNKFDASVQKKKTEDFDITFNTEADLDADFYKKYSTTIDKYDLCDIGEVVSGKVCRRVC